MLVVLGRGCGDVGSDGGSCEGSEDDIGCGGDFGGEVGGFGGARCGGCDSFCIVVSVVIIVLSLTKNVSVWNNAFAYHLTMTGGVGGGVNFGL